MTHKEMLQFAGKLAVACHDLVNSSHYTFSQKFEAMEKALKEYDNVIFNNVGKDVEEE